MLPPPTVHLSEEELENLLKETRKQSLKTSAHFKEDKEFVIETKLLLKDLKRFMENFATQVKSTLISDVRCLVPIRLKRKMIHQQ